MPAIEEKLESLSLNADKSIAVYTGVPGMPGSPTGVGRLGPAALQYRFVKVTGDNMVGLMTDPGAPGAIGVLQNKPQNPGDPATVGYSGISHVIAGAALAAGDPVTCDPEGRAIRLASPIAAVNLATTTTFAVNTGIVTATSAAAHGLAVGDIAYLEPTAAAAVNVATSASFVSDGYLTTIRTAAAHGLAVGDLVRIASATTAGNNGIFVVAEVPTTTTFRVVNTAAKTEDVATPATSTKLLGAYVGFVVVRTVPDATSFTFAAAGATAAAATAGTVTKQIPAHRPLGVCVRGAGQANSLASIALKLL